MLSFTHRADRAKRAFVLAVTVATSVPSAALAAPPTKSDVGDKCATANMSEEDIKEARVHNERATALYRDEEYKLALIEFERAYERSPSCSPVLYNIGQVNLQLGHYAAASTALRHYLEIASAKELAKGRREQVEADLGALEVRTAHLTLTTNVGDPQIFLDDAVITLPTVRLLVDAGQHMLTASKQGYHDVRRSVTLAGGDDRTVSLDLAPLPVAPPPPPREEPHPTAAPASYTWIGWTMTGAFTAGAVVTGILALGAKSDFQATVARPTTADELDSARSRARTLGIVTDVLLGGALVAGGTSLYFTLKKPQKRAPDVRLGIGPAAITAAGTF